MFNISINFKRVGFLLVMFFVVATAFSLFANDAYASDPECDYGPPRTWIQTSNFLGYCNADGTLPQEKVWNGLIPGYVYIDTYYTSKQYDYGPEICGINTYGACPTSIWGCYKEATYYITGSEQVMCDDDGNIYDTQYGSCQVKKEIVDKHCDDRNRGCYNTDIPGPDFSLCPDDYLYYDANKDVTCTKDFYTCSVTDYGGEIGKIGYCLANNICPDPPPGGGEPNFSISLSPLLQIDTKGDAVSYTTYTVTLTAIDGFSSSVSLTSPSCPSGATCSFDGGSTVTVSGPPETKILRITDLDNVNTNTYVVTARGIGGGLTRNGTANLQVNDSGGAGVCDPNAVGVNQFVSCVWDYPGADANLIGLYGIDPSYTLKGVGPTSGVSNPADNYSIAYPPDAVSGWTFPDRGPAGENNTFLVRWRGNFNFTGGKYDFSFPDNTSVDDGAKIIIEDPVFGNREITPYAPNDILNRCWNVACNPLTIPNVDISAGNRTVTVIFREHQGDARIKLNWTKVSSVPPDNPTNVTASNSDCPDIKLNWITAVGADSYRIYRNTSNSAPANPIASGVVIIPWVDSSATVGTNYYYWVESFSNSEGVGSSKVAANVNATGGMAPVACVPQTFSLTVIRSGQGTVTSVPSGIACGVGCQNDFDENTTVVLTATPNVGRVFTGWSGACSGTGQCSVLINAPKTVYANFIIDPNYREF
ncbi:MAG TPA: hypothetical protein VJG67_03655 [Candidatus Paceibacterota bacterium]